MNSPIIILLANHKIYISGNQSAHLRYFFTNQSSAALLSVSVASSSFFYKYSFLYICVSIGQYVLIMRDNEIKAMKTMKMELQRL